MGNLRLHMGCNGIPPREFLVQGNMYIYWIVVDPDVFKEMLNLFQVKNKDKNQLEERIVEYVRNGFASMEINAQDMYFRLKYNKSYTGIIAPANWHYIGLIEGEE